MLEKENSVGIDDMFGMDFVNAMNMFNNVFDRDPFFNNKMNMNFDRDPFFNNKMNIPRRNNKSQSYFSSTVQTVGKDGKVITKQKVNVNNNGKKDSYYTEYYTDKNGKKHLVKDNGNRNLKPRKKKYILAHK